MMGHRERLRDGWEWDAFTEWRRVLNLDRADIKRRFRRRVRRRTRVQLTRVARGEFETC